MESRNDSDIHSIQELDLQRENDRLKTFEKWPVIFLNKNDLAAAGFYYTGNGDAVKCPFCSIGLSCWVPSDIPLNEHQIQSPYCAFIQGRTSYDEGPGNEQFTNEENGLFENNAISLSTESRRAHIPHQVNNCGNNAKYSNYDSYDARLKSFECWPYSHKVPPDTLSLAGFVYTNRDDRTFCFHCGLVLYRWDYEDDPWIEHAYWSPNCKFIGEQKGQEFVNNVEDRRRQNILRLQKDMKNTVKTCKQLVYTKNIHESPSNKEKEKTPNEVSDEKVKTEILQNNEDLTFCLICLTEKRQTVLLPCYHVVCCVNCVRMLKNCCVCREPIIHYKKIFFS